MCTIVSLTSSLAETVKATREAKGLSANALAERSGVSRAMIAKVERAEAQPTAALLGKLSAALGLRSRSGRTSGCIGPTKFARLIDASGP